MSQMNGKQVVYQLDLFRASLNAVMKVLLRTPAEEEGGKFISSCLPIFYMC
jgi:hypothetical protein